MDRSFTGSQKFIKRAQNAIPGGVNSPVRAFGAVGGTPVFIHSAEGPYIYDVDDNKYLDFVGSWGAMIAGHAHEKVVAAINHAAAKGLSFGTPTEAEIIIAENLKNIMPSIEMVRMVNSGTEATMSAIRLARGFTGRDKIIKFEGCYHGHVDSLLVKAGSGALTFGTPTSPGIPDAVAKQTLTLSYNQIDELEQAFEKYGGQIAAVIVEPVAGNMNCIPSVEGFLSGLRNLCDEYGAVLIFDEVMTGFRVGLGGAQEYYKVKPDLTTLGKVIGGGMPVGAFGGKREIMERISPVGPIYQAGTLAGNPLAMTAGLATLEIITAPGFYEDLSRKTAKFARGLVETAENQGVDLTENHVGGMFGIFFTAIDKVETFRQVSACDGEKFKRFFHLMLNRGVYLAPSAFEAGFVSSAHSDEDLDFALNAASGAFAEL